MTSRRGRARASRTPNSTRNQAAAGGGGVPPLGTLGGLLSFGEGGSRADGLVGSSQPSPFGDGPLDPPPAPEIITNQLKPSSVAAPAQNTPAGGPRKIFELPNTLTLVSVTGVASGENWVEVIVPGPTMVIPVFVSEVEGVIVYHEGRTQPTNPVLTFRSRAGCCLLSTPGSWMLQYQTAVAGQRVELMTVDCRSPLMASYQLQRLTEGASFVSEPIANPVTGTSAVIATASAVRTAIQLSAQVDVVYRWGGAVTGSADNDHNGIILAKGDTVTYSDSTLVRAPFHARSADGTSTGNVTVSVWSD